MLSKETIMYEVEVQVRDTKITQASRTALRNAGRIPAVVYDKDGSAINVSIDGREKLDYWFESVEPAV